MTYHVLRNGDGDEILPVVNQESETDKIGQNGARPSFRLDRDVILQRLAEIRKGNKEWTYMNGQNATAVGNMVAHSG